MIRNALAACLLLAQLVMLVYARFEPSAHFHWAPYDIQNEYWIDVVIGGRRLSDAEASERYQEDVPGIDFHAIEHILDVVRQYEETYGKDDGASVTVRYRVNGIFVIAATASLLVLVDWPSAGELQVFRSGGALGRWVARLRRIDFDGSMSVVGRRAVRASELAVCWRGRTYEGIGALATLLLSLPVFYLLALVAFIVPSVLRAMSG